MNEIEELAHTFRLDYRNILDEEPELRTTALEMIKRHLIRSEVVSQYVLIDEYLNDLICRFYFGKRSFGQLWKTKRFRIFNHFILDKVYMLQKLDIVRAIHDVPKEIAGDVALLNDLRNALAHSFFPENRRRKPEWKGKRIYSVEGVDSFLVDVAKLKEFFVKLLFRVSLSADDMY